ncbi:MAG TPA: NADH-quinone oxidoreductase subunit J [Phycisphaerae bacterium]|jgi:NADH:ubiquinone oxidoreductase subunit 6 (subunit J)
MLGTTFVLALVPVAVLCGSGASALAQTAAAPAESPMSGVPTVVSGGPIEAVLFYAFAGVVLLSGLGICISRNIVRMAVWLFGALGAVAALYFLLAANFLGVIQLIVYVGGTLVLLIFGVMLTSKSPWVRFNPKRSEVLAGGVVCASLLACLVLVIKRTQWGPTGSSATGSGASMLTLGQALLSTYLVPFEVASVLLLVVMIGAAYLARQERI